MNNYLDMSNWGVPGSYGLNSQVGLNSLYSPSASLGSWEGLGGLGNTLAPSSGLGGRGFMNSLRSSGFLGNDGNQGWGGLALGAIGGLGSAFMSMQNYGLARDALQSSQDQFTKNYTAQRDTLNTQMEDRQRARVAANSGSESVESYMARNRIN